MGKRHSTGKHTQHRRKAPASTLPIRTVPHNMNMSPLNRMVNTWWNAAYTLLNMNYLVIITLILMVILSFVLPDLSHKIQRSNEISRMKKVLEFMTDEVSKAEASCLTMAKDICYLQCSMTDTATETINEQKDFSVCTSKCLRRTQSEPVQIETTLGFLRRFFCFNNNSPNKKDDDSSSTNTKGHEEIAIMSYLYTDSFDAKRDD